MLHLAAQFSRLSRNRACNQALKRRCFMIDCGDMKATSSTSTCGDIRHWLAEAGNDKYRQKLIGTIMAEDARGRLARKSMYKQSHIARPPRAGMHHHAIMLISKPVASAWPRRDNVKIKLAATRHDVTCAMPHQYYALVSREETRRAEAGG